MKLHGTVLVVDDDRDVLMAAEIFLKRHVTRVLTLSDPSCIPKAVASEGLDVILLDMNFTADMTSGTEGFEWLDQITALDPLVVVVLMTAYADVDVATRTIKAGAADFIEKPWKNEKLLATVSAALSLRESRREAESRRHQVKQLDSDLDRPFAEIIGRSEKMRQVLHLAEKVAPTDANVLITGENGTGKELVARAVHRLSQRSNEVFVRVDVASLPPTLIESELFGHVKGAFTDARDDRPGRFEVASGGTLFLDEIGNLQIEIQAKLLSVLQERQVTRVGANRPRQIDIRLVSATNAQLTELVETGRFRQDLLYRLKTVELRVPPLRERIDDIELLTRHFVRRYGAKYRRGEISISRSAIGRLQRYRWPGNVRELQHAVERAVILCETNALAPGDFSLQSTAASSDVLSVSSLDLETVERAAIEKAITKHDGNISRAAKELGLSRTSLYRRLHRYGL
jgi:DNA-binding NtrC family response regulator